MPSIDQTIPEPAQDSAARAQPPYPLYGAVLGLIVVARFASLLLQNATWLDRLQTPLVGSVFFLGCIGCCVATVLYSRSRTSTALTWMLSALVGGVAMLAVNPILGTATGFAVGGAFLIQRTYFLSFGHLLTTIVRFSLRTVALAIVGGAMTGTLVGMSWLRFAASSSRPSIHVLSIVGPFIVGLTIAVALLRLAYRERRWYGWVGALLLFVPFAGHWCLDHISTQMQTLRTSIETVAVSTVPLRHIVLMSFDPFATETTLSRCDQVDEWLQHFGMDRALGLCVHATFSRASTSEDIARVARIPSIQSVHVQRNCPISDEEFQRLNLQHLSVLTCEEGTQLTHRAFQNIDFSRVGNLDLRGNNFGDEVLAELTEIPWMATIALNGTRVTAEGLKQIDTTGPLYWLHIARTDVDDAVFAVLDKHDRLWWADLSGTQVTGSGIKDFRTDLQHIQLDHSQFDARHLVDFLPPDGEEPTPSNSLSVGYLTLAHTQVDDDTLTNLKRMGSSLKFVDLAGSEFGPNELAPLQLTGYGMDASQVTPHNVTAIGAAEITIHYDASRMTIAEIVLHLNSIVAVRKQLVKTQGHGISITLENFTLTQEEMRLLKPVIADHPISCHHATGPDGDVRNYRYIHEVFIDYPQLNVKP